MLYTTYFNKMSELPEDTIKIIISLYPPEGLVISKNSNTFICPELAPDEDFLLAYKRKEITWDEYTERFMDKIYTNSDTRRLLKEILIGISKGKDIALICYEKDFLHCHRYLIAEYLTRFGIKWKEL